MSKAQKRVEIAKDVIAQIRLRKFMPTRGTYFALSVRDNSLNPQSDLRDLIKAEKSCEVCAIGGIFVADVIKNDKFKNYEVVTDAYDTSIYVDDLDMKSRLLKYFSSKQLQIIECVFEGHSGHMTRSACEVSQGTYVFSKDEADSYEECIRYYRNKYKDDGDRMKAIMLNIIRNKGLFVPPKHTLLK